LLNHINKFMHWLGKISHNLCKRNLGKTHKMLILCLFSRYFDFVHILCSLSQANIGLTISCKYLEQNIIIIRELKQRKAFELCLILIKFDLPIEKIRDREKLLSLHQPVKSMLAILFHINSSIIVFWHVLW
jgi:hypothetical protein